MLWMGEREPGGGGGELYNKTRVFPLGFFPTAGDPLNRPRHVTVLLYFGCSELRDKFSSPFFFLTFTIFPKFIWGYYVADLPHTVQCAELVRGASALYWLDWGVTFGCLWIGANILHGDIRSASMTTLLTIKLLKKEQKNKTKQEALHSCAT